MTSICKTNLNKKNDASIFVDSIANTINETLTKCDCKKAKELDYKQIEISYI